MKAFPVRMLADVAFGNLIKIALIDSMAKNLSCMSHCVIHIFDRSRPNEPFTDPAQRSSHVPGQHSCRIRRGPNLLNSNKYYFHCLLLGFTVSLAARRLGLRTRQRYILVIYLLEYTNKPPPSYTSATRLNSFLFPTSVGVRNITRPKRSEVGSFFSPSCRYLSMRAF